MSEHQTALENYEKALALMKKAGERTGEGLVLYNMGMTHSMMSNRQKALELYGQALTIQRAVGNRSFEASTLGNIGSVYTILGDYPKALEYYRQSLTVKRQVGDPPGEATLFNNIGLIYNRTGEQQKALEHFNEAVLILRAIKDRSGEGTTVNNIGSVYEELGENKKALEYYNEAVEIKRASGNRMEEAIAMGNVGVVYSKLGDNGKALEFYNQALPLIKAAGARGRQATILTNMGKAYSELREHRKALDYYDQALAIQVDVGDRRGQAITLTFIGRSYQELRELPKALEFYNQALPIRRAISDRSGEAYTLYNLARAHRSLNNLADARKTIEEALSAVESLRINVSSPQLRASYLASVRQHYEFDIDVLMRLHKQQPSEGFAAEALHVSEQSRARSLLELLKEAGTRIRQGVDTNLIQEEGRLRQTIAEKAERQTRLLSGRHNADDVKALEKEIEKLASEYEQVEAMIRKTSPVYAKVTQPVPLTLKQIQSLLDDDTLLLEYSLGDDKSFLWAVTPASCSAIELPNRAEIEGVARRLYDALTARNQIITNEVLDKRKQRIARADAEYTNASRSLSKLLLEPIASELKKKRLLIVNEGVLQYIPFAALPDPLAANLKPLIVEHEIVSLPSASVLAVLRQTTAQNQARKTLAVLADPVFSETDPRIAASSGRVPATAKQNPLLADVMRSATESGLPSLVRLRFSRSEAEEISKLIPHQMKLKALDFAASRDLATTADLSEYRIVHFATHGLVNNEHPDLSGIVLSLVDQQGQPRNGFLRLYDIYNLKLSADLVVLSACQTALGKDVKGEGIVGLTRGFMYAGTPRVVASLWRIEDRATAELMRRFYSHMLTGGLRPAAALRAAQIAMLSEPRWQAPHYWAAFTLQGEWK